MRDFSARALCCTKCDGWLHKSCVGMLTAEYEVLEANLLNLPDTPFTSGRVLHGVRVEMTKRKMKKKEKE